MKKGYVFKEENDSKYVIKTRMECMSCPYYEDFTRLCITRFPHIRNYTSFETCQSESHTNCLIFNVLQKKFNCKYLERCALDAIKGVPPLLKYFVEDDKTMRIFREIVVTYCTVEGKACAMCELSALRTGDTTADRTLTEWKKDKNQ